MVVGVERQHAREVTDAGVGAFGRDGWVARPGFVDQDRVAEMLAASKSLMGRSGADWTPRPGLDLDWDHWSDRHFMAREGLEPFRSFACAKEMGKAVQRFNERDVGVRHFSDMIAVKPPAGLGSKSGATPLHQDCPNRHFDRVGAVTFWIALEETPAERGTCHFRSGSHRLGSLGSNFAREQRGGTTPDVHEANPSLAERYPMSEPLDMKPGDATAHGPLVLHGAPGNHSDVARWTYISIYIPADTVWAGTPFLGKGDTPLEVDEPFDHPHHPVIYS